MWSIHRECLGCGLYMESNGKITHRWNTYTIDMANYLIYTSGFVPKKYCGLLDVHFCQDCSDKIIQGDVKVKSFGDVETLRERIRELEENNIELKREFDAYKSKIKSLLS